MLFSLKYLAIIDLPGFSFCHGPHHSLETVFIDVKFNSIHQQENGCCRRAGAFVPSIKG